MLWYDANDFFLARGLLMADFGLSLLALACSVGALATALVVAFRSTPQRVRKAAHEAVQLAEETQNALQVIANRTVSFMEEVTRERASAAGDLEEAERKRRQSAAKLSKLKASGEQADQPKTVRELLETFPPGDPRRIQILRSANTAGQVGGD